MGIIESIKKEKFVVVLEIDPPKGASAATLLETGEILKGRVDALLVSDMPSAVMKMSSISACSILNQNGYDTICNLSCRDRNILALQSDVLGAGALGIENIFINEGDNISFGDHPKATPVNEISSDELLGVLEKLKKGEDHASNKLESALKINTIGLVNPNAAGDTFDLEISKALTLAKKGASFLITTPAFDVHVLNKFVKSIRQESKIPVVSSIILLKSVATARFINMHVHGVNVPDTIIDRLYSAGDKYKESMAITTDLINGFKEICQGVNIQAMGWEAKVPAFLDAAGI